MRDTSDKTVTELMVLDTLLNKQEGGTMKYGTGIRYDMPGYDWIEECIEELADGLQYAVAAKMREADRRALQQQKKDVIIANIQMIIHRMRMEHLMAEDIIDELMILAECIDESFA